MSAGGFGPREFRLSEDVSHETMDRLEIFAELLTKWNRTARLVAASTLKGLWRRHLLDSAQLMDHIPGDAEKLIDVGTGGGFPGLVLAIMAADRQPGTKFVLVDSNERKCDFLREVCRQTGTNAEIRDVRDSELEPQRADVMTARAVAPLDGLLGIASRHLTKDGLCMFLKGKGFMTEIQLAKGHWNFGLTDLQSRSHDSGRILLIRDLKRG